MVFLPPRREPMVPAMAVRGPGESYAERPSSRRPTAEDKIIGQHLRDLRRRAGQSQEWLAGRLGITYQQLGKYERGESSLKVWMMLQAASLLGTSGAAFVDSVAPSGFAEPGSSYEP